MLCPNNVLGFQNFRFTITATSLTVTHMFMNMIYEALALELLSTSLYHILTTDGKLCSNFIKLSMFEKQFQAYSMEELWNCRVVTSSHLLLQLLAVASSCQQRGGNLTHIQLCVHIYVYRC
jgi:hypothetical protein